MNNIREKPILFNTPMVQAISSGVKTETRRLIKPQPCMQLAYISAGFKAGCWGYPPEKAWESWSEQFKRPDDFPKEEAARLWNPPYRGDDILYVRETFAPLYENKASDNVVGYMYKAQNLSEFDAMHPEGKEYCWSGKWKPSIHMPKKAARIWLKVNTVRVARLQDITEEGVTREGVKTKSEFQDVWNSTVPYPYRKCYGWDANPWVWVVRFERIERKSQ